MRERGGGEIAGLPIVLATLFSHPCCGKGFKFVERNARGLLVRRHQPVISQRHRQHRNRFRRGTGEIIKHPALVLLLLPLRQPFAGFRILIFAQRMKLFAGDDVFQSQPFRARADPLAGTDFTGGVVIVLRQMLVEVTLGIGQIFMRDGSEHKTRYYRFSKTLCSFWNNR